MTMRRTRRGALGLLAGLAFVSGAAAFSGAPEIFMDKGGLFGSPWDYAVGGYDVVAYYDLEAGAAPVAGSDDFVADYKGVQWRFASKAHLDAFNADPGRYRPQYGGYCAWAMARGKLAKGDPAIWTVYGGKLYLNFNNSIQKKWLKDIDAEIDRADANWPGALERN